jgi:hypothetical protein
MMFLSFRPTRNRQLSGLVLSIAVLFAAVHAAAQPDAASTGSITGTAVGANGEVYAGVQVALSGAGFSSPRMQTTGDDGQFRFVDVPAGPFRITLSSGGFATRTVDGVLGAGQVYDVHAVVLTLARATSNVVVAGASQHDIAQQQINVELKQRILGVIPNFYVSYDQHFAPMTARQKLYLALKSNVDPVTFAGAGIVAGVEQADNTFPAYGQGAGGYATRFGQAYGDGFIANLVGNGLLASAFKQDPRFFYKGTGSVGSRIWYSVYTSVMCKGDNGHWQLDYSGIMGGLAASGISDLYYPAQNRNGAAIIFEGASLGIGIGMLENLAQEFLIKKITPHAGKLSSQQP